MSLSFAGLGCPFEPERSPNPPSSQRAAHERNRFHARMFSSDAESPVHGAKLVGGQRTALELEEC